MDREEIIFNVAKEIFIKWKVESGATIEITGDQFKILTKKVEEAFDLIKK